MVGEGPHRAVQLLADGHTPLRHQVLDVRRVVDHVVLATELRVLVPELVEAVRAGGDDGAHSILGERLDVVLREHLVEVLVPHPARRVAVALLLLAEDREADPGGLEDAREGHGGLLRAIVERAHAPDPIQDLGGLSPRGQLGHRRDLHPLGPLAAVARVEGPRGAARLHRLEGGHQLLGEARLAEDEVAPELVDDGELIDGDGALVDAGAARGTGPELLLGDVAVEEGALGDRGGGVRREHRDAGGGGQRPRGLLLQPLAHVDHDLPRGEELPRRVGRTDRGAPSALGAREPVEERLPAQVLDVLGAELLGVRALEVHRTHRADHPRTTRVREVGVRERRDDVQVLGVRQVVQEAQDQQRVGPPGEVVQQHRRRHPRPCPELHEKDRERVAHRPHPGEMQRLRGDREGFRQEHRDHQRADPREDEQRVVRVRLGPLEALHALGEAAPERHRDHREDDRREGLLTQHVAAIERRGEDALVAEPGDDALDEHLRRAGAEDEEAPEDQGVHRSRDRVAEDLRLEDPDREEVPEARGEVAPARVVEPAEPQLADEALDVRREEPERGDEDEEEESVRRRHLGHPAALACFTASVSTGRISSTSPTMP